MFFFCIVANVAISVESCFRPIEEVVLAEARQEVRLEKIIRDINTDLQEGEDVPPSQYSILFSFS